MRPWVCGRVSNCYCRSRGLVAWERSDYELMAESMIEKRRAQGGTRRRNRPYRPPIFWFLSSKTVCVCFISPCQTSQASPGAQLPYLEFSPSSQLPASCVHTPPPQCASGFGFLASPPLATSPLSRLRPS